MTEQAPTAIPQDAPLTEDTALEEAHRHEELRKRIYDMRARGLSYAAIGKIVQLKPQTVHYHYKKARAEVVQTIEEEGWKLTAGKNLKRYQRAQEICLSHLAALEQGEIDEATGQPRPGTSKKGSIQAAIWMQTYLRACKQEEDYAFELGVMPRAKEQLEVTFKDARAMSIEELQNECAALEAQLSRARIVPDAKVKEMKRLTHTIEATATVKNVEEPERVERAAKRLGKLDE